jgi:hypothetical protein
MQIALLSAIAVLAAAPPGSAQKTETPAVNGSPAASQPSTAPVAEDRTGQAPVGEFDAQRSANAQNPQASGKIKAMAKGDCRQDDRSKDPSQLCKQGDTTPPR